MEALVVFCIYEVLTNTIRGKLIPASTYQNHPVEEVERIFESLVFEHLYKVRSLNLVRSDIL